MIALPFFPCPLNSRYMPMILLHGPLPQTLTCNCHYKAACKVQFLSQFFSLFYMNDHPAFPSSSVQVSFHAKHLDLWASSTNVDV